MSKIGVETSQHIKLNYKPAGITERIIAYFLDGIVLIAYWLFLVAIAAIGDDPKSITSTETSDGQEYLWLGMLIILLPIMLYHLIIEILWNGYSVGKWLMGIRVVKLDGTRPELSNYLIRWLIRLIEVTMTSGGLALITILVNGKGQRLGDIAAKTCVIRVKRTTKLSDTVFEDFKDNYEAIFPQVMELNDQDISVINEVLKSREKYEYATWLELVAKVKIHTQQKMGLTSINMTDVSFLKQVQKDYNALNGILD